MGQTLSQEIEKRPNDHEQVAELRKREGEMRQKYEEKKAKLYIGALNDECLPIICAVDKFSEFLFNVKKPEISTPEDPFGIGIKMKKHLYGEYLTEFIALLGGVLEKVLEEKTETVEQEHLHVVIANRSVLRIDYYLYLHKFKSGTEDLNSLFYYVQVGVIDMERVRLPVLMYELTRATKSEDLNKAGVELTHITQPSTTLYAILKTLVAATKSNTTGAEILQQSTTMQQQVATTSVTSSTVEERQRGTAAVPPIGQQ